MSESYTNNDQKQWLYLNDQINLWIKNKIFRSIDIKDFTSNGVKDALSKKQTDFLKNVKLFFNNSNQLKKTSCSVRILRWYSKGNQIQYQVVDGSQLSNTLLKIDIDHNYRVLLKNDEYVTALYYDFSYITNPESLEDFYPDDTLNFAEIVPFMYLESCTSYLHPFFRSIFQIKDSSVDGINTRCINDANNINIACGIEKNNIRCACQPCYSKHSNQSRHIGELLNKSNAVSKDPWCIYPDCASGVAFKNRLVQKRSECNNISVAGVFLNPSEYSNINISNTLVSASSSNDNGINLYGDGNCPEGQHFEVDNKTKTIKCVDNDDNVNNDQNLETLNQSNSSLKSNNDQNPETLKQSNKLIHWSIYAIISSISITIILLTVYKFSNIDVEYKKYLMKGIIFGVFLTIFFIIYYVVNKTKEGYNCNDLDGKLCYYDLQCTRADTKCLDNECLCDIGFFTDGDGNCMIYPDLSSNDYIIIDFPYLPSSVFTGPYYYSTVVNNEIYVFALDCNFKYDGKRWQELATFDGQEGFHPYNPSPPFYNEIYIEFKLKLNNSTSYTYKDKVYIVVAPNTLIKRRDNNNSRVLVYDTINNEWEYSTFHADEDQTLLRYTIVIKDNLIYTFGYSGNRVLIDNLDTKTYKFNVIKGKETYMFGNYSYSFVYNDTIYICDMYTGDYDYDHYHIWSYDPVENNFNHIHTFENFIDRGPNIDGSGCFPFYLDGIFYLFGMMILNDGTNVPVFSYYDIENDYEEFVLLEQPYRSTSIFQNPTNDPTSETTNYIYNFSRGNTMFYKNEFFFIVTGSGEIFRLYMVKDSKGKIKKVNINPCYGVPSYGQPINRRIDQI